MKRTIDAERLKALIFNACIDEHFKPTKLLSWDNITDIINNAPTVEERPTGKWLNTWDKGEYNCSHCSALIKHDLSSITGYRYCPRCGAKMKEGEEE